MPALRTLAGFALLAGSLLWKAGLRPPRRLTTAERLAMLPRTGLPLRQPVAIHWNDHQVPFVEAESEADLAVALGLIHAHLRLGQLELMRRAAYGRLAELAGPVAVELDRTLRTLDLPRAVPGMIAGLPPATRTWLEGFAAGINAQIAGQHRLPHDLALLGCKPEPWSVADLLAIGRLAGTDFTWKVWVDLLRFRGRPDWLEVWQRLMEEGVPLPSFAGAGSAAIRPERVLDAFRWGGSNSAAVGAARSAHGSALIASDPHLSVMLPNLWLIVGMRCPTINAVGLMIPGVPVLALGRNRSIGWGGTSLHAASSELFDVTELGPEGIRQRQETIRVRWGKPRQVTIRSSDYGPIISDAPLLRAPAGRDLALHWIGHRPSDEVTAMLGVLRADGWAAFHAALEGFAVPAQNMIYADRTGRVGQAMAAHLPRRPLGAPADILAAPAHLRHWESLVTARELPAATDPEAGFVASANNRPGPTVTPVGFFFSPEDRIRRLRQLLGGAPVDRAALEALQRDVLVPSALVHRDLLLRHHRAAGHERTAERRLWQALRSWDGRYDAESEGALAFELLIHHFVLALHGSEDQALYAASTDPWALLRDDLDRLPPDRLAGALAVAAVEAATAMSGHADWGDVHRLRLTHMLGALPLIGRRYRLPDLRSAGTNESLMKTAYGSAPGRHRVRYGANARHISDFADNDANLFVLLGGQDGWLGSANFADQVPLWRRGDYIAVPLDAGAARAWPHHTTLQPASPAAP